MRRNFSLVARYSLKSARCSLLVVRWLVTRLKIRSLLVAEVARCKKSLVTRCRSCSLQKINRYSLQNSLVACCRSGVTFCNFMTKSRHHRCFPVNFCETLRTPILQNQLLETANNHLYT